MSEGDSRSIHEHHQQERVRGSSTGGGTSSNGPTSDDESRAAEVDRQLRDASERLFFVFPELRAAFLEPTLSSNTSRTATALILQQQEATGQPQQQQQQPYPPPDNNSNNNHIPTTSSSTSTIMSTMERQTGVLWKRRDVFKNRWRPRWFSLNPGQGVLTYYLLSSTSAAPLPTTTVSGGGGTDSINHTDPSLSQRHRTTSWDSQVSAVSENSLDYDVVPRGTIYLLGCTVAINEQLSRPNENLFAFTIRPPSAADSNIHLAARTAEARDVWVSKMDRVCRIGTVSPTASPTSSPTTAATLQRPPRPARTPRSAAVNGNSSSRRLSTPEHSIPEGDLENSTSEPEITENDDNDAELPEESLLEDDDENDMVDEEEESSHEWRATGLASSLYENVPAPLAARIQETLQRHLPLILDEYNHDDNNRTNIPWKLLFHHRDTGHRAYEWIDNENGRSMIQSQAVLNVPPKQVFSLLVDVARRPDFETNVRVGERVRLWNSHTFGDYYAYNAVWPTAAREFAVVTHWQVVGRGDEKAIAMVSFSCPEADAVKAVAPKHVRGNLFVSMYLLRTVVVHPHRGGGEEQCRMTRLLSFDLAGGVNQHLSNVIVAQQASLPAVVEEYLQRHEPVTENRYRGLLSNDAVRSSVIDRLGQQDGAAVSNGSDAVRLRAPSPLSQEEGSIVVGSEDASATAADGKTTSSSPSESEKRPAIESQAVILLAPPLFYWFMYYFGLSGTAASLLFCVSAFLAVRQVVLWHQGERLTPNEEASLVGPVTCRFQVDLKGVLRFIANKREEREELMAGTADVSVVHIVASAVARAMRMEPELHHRRITIPWLLIDQIVDTSSEPVDVSVSENSGGIVTLKAVDRKKIQTLADELAEAEESTSKTKEMGQCLVVAVSHNDDASEVETDAAPVHRDVAVVAVVGGVHLEHKPQVSPRSSGSKRTLPRPVLSLSLTMAGHHQADIVTCRRYAEEVRKLLQFPEIMDHSEGKS